MMKRLFLIVVLFNVFHILQAETTTMGNQEAKTKCENNDSVACVIYGQLNVHNQDYINANVYFKKACKLEHGGGCYLSGVILNAMNEKKAALDSFKRGCSLSNLTACQEYDRLTNYKEHIEKKRWKKICDEGGASACEKYKNYSK